MATPYGEPYEPGKPGFCTKIGVATLTLLCYEAAPQASDTPPAAPDHPLGRIKEMADDMEQRLVALINCSTERLLARINVLDLRMGAVEARLGAIESRLSSLECWVAALSRKP